MLSPHTVASMPEPRFSPSWLRLVYHRRHHMGSKAVGVPTGPTDRGKESAKVVGADCGAPAERPAEPLGGVVPHDLDHVHHADDRAVHKVVGSGPDAGHREGGRIDAHQSSRRSPAFNSGRDNAEDETNEPEAPEIGCKETAPPAGARALRIRLAHRPAFLLAGTLTGTGVLPPRQARSMTQRVTAWW